MNMQNHVYDQKFVNDFLPTINYSLEEINNGAKLDTLQTHHLFQIHNEVAFPKNKEWSKSCAPCRLRVYKKVFNWYNDQDWKTFIPKLVQ